MSTINKAKDNATYYANRAESKLSEVKQDLSKAAQEIKAQTRQAIQEGKNFWEKNGTTLIVGSGVAALGILLVSRLTR